MIRHVVLFTWKADACRAAIDAVQEGLHRLPEQVPGTRGFVFGADAGLAEGNYDLAVVADFDDHDQYLDYAQHPAHAEFVERLLRPVLERRAAVQFEFTPSSAPTPAG